MRSCGWAPIHYGWGPYARESGHKDRHPQKEDSGMMHRVCHVKMQDQSDASAHQGVPEATGNAETVTEGTCFLSVFHGSKAPLTP